MSQDADWRAGAAHAAKDIQSARRGDRLSIVRRHATSMGISAGLLRRALVAHDFLEELEKSGVDIPPEIRRAPIGVVDIVARWAKHDREAAFAAGIAHIAGDLTYRDLLAREAACRPGGASLRPPRWIDVQRAWKEAVLAQIKTQRRFRGLRIVDPTPDDPPIDAWIEGKGEGRMGAMIVVGPYLEHSDFGRDRETWIFRTIGIARVAGRIWMIVPTKEHAESYAHRLARWSIPETDVSVVPLVRSPDLAAFMGPKSQLATFAEDDVEGANEVD